MENTKHVASLSNCILVLRYLRKNVNTLVKQTELAKECNVEKRRVRSYIYVLKDLNYNIISKSGKQGGMMLQEITLTQEELLQLQDMLKDNKELYNKIEYINNRI
jgi:predicted transcriptional regulator